MSPAELRVEARKVLHLPVEDQESTSHILARLWSAGCPATRDLRKRFIDEEDETHIDRWHNGYFAKERPTDPDELEGWTQAQEERKVRVVMPARPEGYYHMPLGTFD